MALTVKIGNAAAEAPTPTAPPVKIRLKVRKTVDGNLLISDHPDIDISKFIEEESQYFNLDDELEAEFEKNLTEPDEEDSTELGEVPHSAQRGSIRPGYIYSPYGISSAYRYE